MSQYCLVVLPTPLVAQDLALTLQDLTGCHAITADRMDDACQKLAAMPPGSLLYAFVHCEIAEFRDSPLRILIERLGGKFVLLGHAAELEAAQAPEGTSWPVLGQPFGPEQVAALLAQVPRHAPEAG